MSDRGEAPKLADEVKMGFWQSRRVLVSGGAGFLGSYVTQELRRSGCSNIFVPRSGITIWLKIKPAGEHIKISGRTSSFTLRRWSEGLVLTRRILGNSSMKI